MCDVLMLAFWVWAMVWWVEGMETESVWKLGGAGLLMALAALTKYFGAALIPLLAVYGLMSKRRFGLWAGWLLIPILGLCLYQWAMRSLYQHNLLANAAHYASYKSGFFSGARISAAMTALAFTGGGLAAAAFVAPWWSWRARPVLMMVGGTLAMGLCARSTLLQAYHWIHGWSLASLEGQMLFWAISGISLLALAALDVRDRRDARSWLLALWIFGTFVFTGVLNWTINGRSVLPMVPAVGILLARRWQPGNGRMIIGLAASAVFAFLVARADFLFAVAARQSAWQASERFGHSRHTLWFQGHWGFQYSLAELGGQALDMQHPGFRNGDVMVVPLNNTNLDPPGAPRNGFYVDGPRWLADMNLYVGAGFYGSADGPLPFVFGHVPPENVAIYIWNSAR